ncbi:hypothetical protein OPKNFCMD_3944 [Methylobacterium crusticola]|uniref:HTH hxlR-type domain-containing protein n=1 Tax=Methylobacterium crusticola TaxID=1697972 RepID=A0ABQ4R0I7_9HYPH|nr:helix-turn-helix domain-containing protein [Methylobacterium crusticola]GJD51192.1 hypothetical protein OPKNFCMD_3944 [Methylobacterium crusticola]
MAPRLSPHLCPRYQRALDLLGKRWNGLILRVLSGGPLRFGELAQRLEVVGDRILAERLKELEAEGLVTRRVVPSTPVRVAYALTEKGQSLAPIMASIEVWADRWMSAAAAAPAGPDDAPALTGTARDRPARGPA